MRPKNETKEFFTLSDGQAITDVIVRKWLRILSDALHLKAINPHDMRIGGATWAASQGWPDSMIRAHGRWRSDAFLQYIRPF